MQLHFTFRHVEPSEGIKNYATEKISKMQKYLRSPLDADLIFSMERHLHCVEILMRADGERYAGKVESDDMYASIDLVIDKLDRQVRDRKDEANDRKRHAGGVSQLSGKRGNVPGA